MSTCLDAARQYLALGLHPIPADGKRPLVPWREYQEHPPHAGQIDEWWSTRPDANVALVLGRGTFAVDLDGEGAERLLMDQGIYLPGAPRVTTGRGQHVYLSADGPVPDRVGLLTTRGGKPQVDIRGVGIVIAPPSIHPETHTPYAWRQPLVVPFPSAPASLLELIRAGGRPRATEHQGTGWVLEALQGVGDGLRDATCTKLAGYLIGRGLDAATTEALLIDTFAPRCTPPFPPGEVRKCVQSIARKHRAEPDDRALSPVPIGDALDAFEAELRTGRRGLVPTPFGALNTVLGGGFAPGELIYLGARPGVGKTALGLEIARRAAKGGVGALIISREMVNAALARRMVAQESQVWASLLRGGRLQDAEDQAAVAGAVRQLRGLPIWLSDAAVSLGQVEALVREWREPTALGLLIVDYLQLVRAPKEIKDRRLQVEAVSQGLKALAIGAGIPVLCLSSLSRPIRDGKSADEPRPTLASLRESGELEHDADVVLLLHRAWKEDPAVPAECECIVAKNRDGYHGTLKLLFTPRTVSFQEKATA